MTKIINRICHTEYYPLYAKLTKDDKDLVRQKMGFFTRISFSNSKSITENQYNVLKEFAENYVSFNTIGFEAYFDNEQLKHYYKELNNLIGSPEFQKYTKKEKNLVIDEQMRMGKAIINNN